MNLILTVQNKRTDDQWTEEYDSDNLTKPRCFGHRRKETVRVESKAEAAAWGKSLIAWFNSTCAPGESQRLLLKVELVPNEKVEAPK
jgi:hypothetical protein